ncbi:MAG: glycosyltransferase [Candidatus Firestonebacteria bacterium]|nr:glycosyltransferase [Candidatus Firestonebacteria bacterium]
MLVLYTFIGYPLFLAFLAMFKKKKAQDRPEYFPKVSLIILAGNEQKNIKAKLDNCLSLEYPKEKLEIIVAVIDSADNTRKKVEDYFSKGIKLLFQVEKKSSNMTVNAVVSEAKGEVVVITDASSIIEKYSLKNLARHFVDKNVGLVAGNIEIANKDNNFLVLGEKAFLEFQRFIQQSSSKLRRVISVNPELYALRKADFTNLKDDGVEAKTAVPIMYSYANKTRLYEPLAQALKTINTKTKANLEGKLAATQKALVSAKCIKELFRAKKYFTILQFISFELLYGLFGVLLFAFFLCNLTVLGKPGYVVFFSLQFLFYVAGALKISAFAYYVTFSAYAHVSGLARLIKKERENAKG